jgi:hypothetical protein
MRFGWGRRPLREEPLYRLPKRILMDAQLYLVAALVLLALPFVLVQWTMQLVRWLKEHVPEPIAIGVVVVGLAALFVRRR